MPYNPKKAAQVIAFFIAQTVDKKIDILKAVKLVYLADRESIRTTGFPILDEQRFSMPHGPVNSETYEHIRDEAKTAGTGWDLYLSAPSEHKISLKKSALSDKALMSLNGLSAHDRVCLQSVWDQFGAFEKWALVDWTHDPKNLPEWEDPNGSSAPIPLQRIMLAVGVENPAEMAQHVIEAEAAQNFLDQLDQHERHSI